MRTIAITFVLILSSHFGISGQKVLTDEEILKNLADDIVEHTNYRFYDNNTKNTFEDITPEMPVKRIKLSSPYTDWRYWNGVLNIGLLKYAAYSVMQSIRRL